MDHLTNCHGELWFALQFLFYVPVFGAWLRGRMRALRPNLGKDAYKPDQGGA